MRKILLVVFVLALGKTSFSQNLFQINSNYVESSGFTISDLFSFTIASTSATPSNGRVELELREKTSGKFIVKAVNQNTTLNPGINLFLISDFQIEYFNNEASNSFQLGSFLTSGNYEICIRLTSSHSENGNLVHCDILSIKSDFFIHLLSPTDNEEIETTHPNLIWMSTSVSPAMTYRLMVAPLAPFERPEEALMNNLKFIDLEVSEMQYLYPLDAPIIEYGKHYAWQVFAINEGSVIGISEAWVFTPVNKFEIRKEKHDCYRVITKNFNNGNYLYGEVMKFAFENRDSETDLRYSILDLTTGSTLSKQPRIKLKSGLNKIDIDLKKVSGVKKGHHYLLKIVDSSNDDYKLTFTPYAKTKLRE